LVPDVAYALRNSKEIVDLENHLSNDENQLESLEKVLESITELFQEITINPDGPNDQQNVSKTRISFFQFCHEFDQFSEGQMCLQ
jgi:poly(A) polymerase Pap1